MRRSVAKFFQFVTAKGFVLTELRRQFNDRLLTSREKWSRPPPSGSGGSGPPTPVGDVRANLTPFFFSRLQKLLRSVSISRGAQSEVGGGGKLPRLHPSPPVATPLINRIQRQFVCAGSKIYRIQRQLFSTRSKIHMIQRQTVLGRIQDP